MEAEPKPPAQTPHIFTLAGASDMMSDDCKKTVEQAGYPSDCFGSYDDVRAKIEEAKTNVATYEADQKRKHQTIDPTKPSARDRFLANCQAGHVSQNAIYQHPGQRGNSCMNVGAECDNGNPTWDAACYHSRMAPCMPIPGPAGSPGTPHQLMSVDENTARQLKNPHERPPEPPNYLLMGRPEITYHSRKSVAVAVKAGLGSAGENSAREELKQAKKIAKQRRKLNNQLENLKGEKNKQKRDEKKAELEELTKKEGELRSGAAAKLQRESAAQMAKDRAKAEGTEAKGPPSASDPQEVDALAQEVAKCVETFRQNGMKAMRAQIQQQYSGQNLQDIREKTKANKDQASKDFAIAKANKEKGIPDQETADREHKKAGRNFGEAIKEYNNVDCLAEQAKHLSEAPADITGRIPLLPPPKPKSTSGSQSTKKEK